MSKVSNPIVVSVVLFLFPFLSAMAAESRGNWPTWRGPTGNGVSEAEGLPATWSSTDNIAWKVPLPGSSGSTPIVWEGRIFLTSAENGKNIVMAFDLKGNKLWQQALGDNVPAKHREKGSGSHPSPVTDGQLLFAYFRSGDLAGMDLDGTIRWHKNLQTLYGPDTLWWDLGTSPVLTRDHVVVAVMHDKPSYIVSFNKKTGDVAWKMDRSLNAPREANHSYTTPVVQTEGSNQTIYVLGADHITAHDASEGKELWRVGGLNPDGQEFFRSVASPVLSDGILIAPYSRGRTHTAVRLGGSGDVTHSHVLWTRKDLSTDLPTPAAVNGKLYLATDRGGFHCVDIRTGKDIWSGKLEERTVTISASPILADGKIYVTSDKGTTYVLQQGDEFKLLSANPLGEFTLATPVCTDGHILIRTFKHLWCIGK